MEIRQNLKQSQHCLNISEKSGKMTNIKIWVINVQVGILGGGGGGVVGEQVYIHQSDMIRTRLNLIYPFLILITSHYTLGGTTW